MKEKNKLIHYGYIIYFLLLIIITIISILFDITFISITSRIIAYIVYYVVALIGVYSLYKTNDNFSLFTSGIIVIIIILLSLLILIFGDIWIMPPMIILLSLIFKKKYHLLFKILASLMITPVILMFILVLLFNSTNFASTEIMEAISSPDGNYRVVQIYVDQGALGSNIVLKLERNYFNIIKISKRLMISNKELEIEWVDDECLSIDGTIQKVTLFADWN